MVTINIIICTNNGYYNLFKTVVAMQMVRIPDNFSCELIVVDNASTDHTAQIIRSAAVGRMVTRYVFEPRPGLSVARNTGLAAAHGDIILFTDDDVRPLPNWVEAMCLPILLGQAHVVAGGVRIPSHLERPWMEPLHRAWLAEYSSSSEYGCAKDMIGLVGANMGFSREVLSKVPSFDTNLGAGALGFGEDSLFSLMLRKAGYRFAFVPQYVEHHFDESRLRRESFISAARKRGRSAAYIAHHWEHRDVTAPQLRLAKRRMLLTYQRWRQRRTVQPEGMPTWEMHALWSVSFYEQLLVERRSPHRYDRGDAISGGSSRLVEGWQDGTHSFDHHLQLER